MGTTFRFIEAPSEQSQVLAWFHALPDPPVLVPTARGAAMHFKSAGPLIYDSGGSIDVKLSPVATVFLPHPARGVLWTVGEVHFLSTPLRQSFPSVYKVSSAFSKWLASHECVFNNKAASNLYNYYLEGSVQNHDAPVYAFESGLSALKAGTYFVADGESDFVLEKLYKSLRLRGIQCTSAQQGVEGSTSPPSAEPRP
jgi:hypothetical protein